MTFIFYPFLLILSFSAYAAETSFEDEFNRYLKPLSRNFCQSYTVSFGIDRDSSLHPQNQVGERSSDRLASSMNKFAVILAAESNTPTNVWMMDALALKLVPFLKDSINDERAQETLTQIKNESDQTRVRNSSRRVFEFIEQNPIISYSDIGLEVGSAKDSYDLAFKVHLYDVSARKYAIEMNYDDSLMEELIEQAMAQVRDQDEQIFIPTSDHSDTGYQIHAQATGNRCPENAPGLPVFVKKSL